MNHCQPKRRKFSRPAPILPRPVTQFFRAEFQRTFLSLSGESYALKTFQLRIDAAARLW